MPRRFKRGASCVCARSSQHREARALKLGRDFGLCPSVTKHDFAFAKNSPWFAISLTEGTRTENEIRPGRKRGRSCYCGSRLLYLREQTAPGNSHAVCRRASAPRRTNKWRPRTTMCLFPVFLHLVFIFLCVSSKSSFPTFNVLCLRKLPNKLCEKLSSSETRNL